MDQANPQQIEQARRDAARLRVALVHDWLVGMRGGERVLEALLGLFPRAEVYTLVYDPRGICGPINRRAIYPSPLSTLPGVHRYYRLLLPLMPSAIGRLRLARGTDLVLSTSHCVAHGVAAPPGACHLTYCFSPMRYLYDERRTYSRGGAAWGAKMLDVIAGRLKRWDGAAARRCGRYWAISRAVADRIQRIYGLEAPVVYPPVQSDFFTPSPSIRPERGRAQDKGPYLIVSALVPYKRVDVAIEAANRVGAELIVAGKGPMRRALGRIAGPTVRFVGWASQDELRELYRSCRALIFPGEEDFGIVPLEAMACGKPVLALRAGGLTETLVEGETGAFFNRCDPQSLAEAWARFDPRAYDAAALRRRAEQFSTTRFLNEFAVKLMSTLQGASKDA